MKLLVKTNLINQILFSLILLSAGIAIFLSVREEIDLEFNEAMYFNCLRVEEKIKNNENFVDLPPTMDVDTLDYCAITKTQVSDTLMFDPISGEHENFRQITTTLHYKGKFYRTTFRQEAIEDEEYFNSIGIPLMIIFGILLIALILVNYFVAKNIWRSFYRNLEIIQDYDVQRTEEIELTPSSVREFKELNTAIQKLCERVKTQFEALKSFTENASHEIQTPISIARLEVEELMQSDLSKMEATRIEKIYSSLDRLSKLNRALLLLTKLENNQFKRKQQINLSLEVKDKVHDLEELIKDKSLELSLTIKADCFLQTDENLVNLLLDNLLSNAIKHNSQDGLLRIELTEEYFEVHNSGEEPDKDPSSFLNRFEKANQSSASLGLGLSIVHEICRINEWDISYKYSDSLHKLKIQF